MTDVKKGDTVLVVGTKKGLFLVHSRDRRRWRVRGPWFEGVSVHHATLDPRDGQTVWAGVTSEHWGPTVQRSRTFGARWLREAEQPRFPEGSGLSVKRVWHLAPGVEGELWAGVEPGGLFRSDDDGKTWHSVDGLNLHRTRPEWMPGGGGLCLHTILPDPRDARSLVVGISAVGILETRDGGMTWQARNGNIRADHLPDKVTAEETLGSCPHKLVRDPHVPGTLYMQNHFGVYRRDEDDAGWRDIGRKLPSRFGFPMAVHPETGDLYLVPLVGDHNRVTHDGAMAVWRGAGDGRSWARLHKGLPQKDAYLTVLREGLAVDGKDPLGVYVGTTGGHLFASRDEGDSWETVSTHLPPILSVEAGVAR